MGGLPDPTRAHRNRGAWRQGEGVEGRCQEWEGAGGHADRRGLGPALWKSAMASSDVNEPQTPDPGLSPRMTTGRPLFTWKYKHNVDGQGRIQCPQKWRLRASDSELVAVVLQHEVTKKNYILVLPVDLFGQFSAKLCADSFTSVKAQARRHYFAERIMALDFDGAGRFMLPGELRTPANLGKEALLVGCIDRFEIWNADDYVDACAKEEPILIAEKSDPNNP